jgi:ABC-2 type transport system permease protein
MFKLSRARAIAAKEVRHILRDPFTLAMALGLPLLMVIFFGFAINFDVKDIRTAAFDFDRSHSSRELLRVFSSSGYFIVKNQPPTTTPVAEVESERASLAVVINPDFGKDTGNGSSAKVQLLVDGSDNLKAGVIMGYLSGLQAAAAKVFSSAKPAQTSVNIVTRYLYNPELNTQWFIVPGLIAVITGILSILLTAMTVAREWENGSMELLLSTPVEPIEVIIGKLAPYLGLGLLAILFVYLMARTVFNVPFLGSYPLLGISCILYITTLLAQGILISVVTRQQQKAMQGSMIAGMLPALLLSGFVFPVESMPVIFKYITIILPARWFLEIVRSVVLKGSLFKELLVPFVALAVMNVFFITVAVKRFKKDIEP